MAIIAGIDVGTQSAKVLLYDTASRHIVASSQAPIQLIAKEDGTREQKASWWTDAIITCFNQIAPSLKNAIEAIGVSGQQHGFVPIDEHGHVLYNVKLWNDVSTATECDEITHCAGGVENLINTEGNAILPGYTASKILWFKKHHPQLYQKMAFVMLPHDYINYWLTGTVVMEYGDASGTGLLDIRSRKWSKRLCHCIDDSDKLLQALPPLIEPYEAAGYVQKEIAELLNIPSGVVVSSGGGDNMMGAVGTGTVKDGTLTMSLGTSGTLFGASDKPIIDPQGYLAAFCSSTGSWLPLLCTMNCTVASEQTRALWNQDVKQFDATAALAPIGCEGVVMLPYFNGERTPNYPKGKGCLMGFDMNNTTQQNINRAALESAIFGMKLGLDAFIALGYEARQIRLIGGGAKSKLWRQMVADICNLPVVVPSIKEAAAFGAILQALWTLEHAQGVTIEQIVAEHVVLDSESACEPIDSHVSQYKEAYARYQEYVEAVKPLFR